MTSAFRTFAFALIGNIPLSVVMHADAAGGWKRQAKYAKYATYLEIHSSQVSVCGMVAHLPTHFVYSNSRADREKVDKKRCLPQNSATYPQLNGAEIDLCSRHGTSIDIASRDTPTKHPR